MEMSLDAPDVAPNLFAGVYWMIDLDVGYRGMFTSSLLIH